MKSIICEKISRPMYMCVPLGFTGELTQKGIDFQVDYNHFCWIKDSAADPAKAISFTRQRIEEEKVFTIIGPSTSGETLKIKSICQKSKTILISCASAELIVNPVLPYVFKTAPSDSYAARKIFPPLAAIRMMPCLFLPKQ